jgi:glutaconate CoA-transferase subunit A
VIDRTGSLLDAVHLVKDDDVIGLGGMTIYRRPVGFVKAFIQQEQPPQNLTLLAFTAGIGGDMLVGAGVVNKVRTCYFGLEIFGLAPNFTAAANKGELEIIEESEASLACGIRAQLAGVGFMPSPAWQGTDMFSVRPDVKLIEDPYTGEQLTAFPAISCDVAVIHVLKADRSGNCVLGGNPTIDLELAIMATTVIITAEEVVDKIEGKVDIISDNIDIVIHLPGGASPTSCYPLYPIDGKEILRYITYCTRGRLIEYLEELSFEPASLN